MAAGLADSASKGSGSVSGLLGAGQDVGILPHVRHSGDPADWGIRSPRLGPSISVSTATCQDLYPRGADER